MDESKEAEHWDGEIASLVELIADHLVEDVETEEATA
jgi:hypothetical protein